MTKSPELTKPFWFLVVSLFLYIATVESKRGQWIPINLPIPQPGGAATAATTAATTADTTASTTMAPACVMVMGCTDAADCMPAATGGGMTCPAGAASIMDCYWPLPCTGAVAGTPNCTCGP